jgi:hypothetical protein
LNPPIKPNDMTRREAPPPFDGSKDALIGTRLGHGVPNQRYRSGPFNAAVTGKANGEGGNRTHDTTFSEGEEEEEDDWPWMQGLS